MALWKNTVKNNGNAACKNKRQHLEKGMFALWITLWKSREITFS